jgi:hypothetical protein
VACSECPSWIVNFALVLDPLTIPDLQVLVKVNV